MKIDPVIARNINRAAMIQSCMKDRDCIVLRHVDLIQNTETAILGTLIDAALSEADFIVHKGIRPDQISAVCIDMEGYIIDRAAKSIGQIFCQDIFSCGLRARKKKIFPFQKSCNGHFQDLFSVERNGRSGNSGCSRFINAMIFSKFFDAADQVFGNVLFF